MFGLSRIVLLGVFVALLAGSPSLAETPRHRGEARRASLTGPAAKVLLRLWSIVAVPAGKVGMILDPHGACASGEAATCGEQQPPGEVGGIIDPHGGN